MYFDKHWQIVWNGLIYANQSGEEIFKTICTAWLQVTKLRFEFSRHSLILPFDWLSASAIPKRDFFCTFVPVAQQSNNSPSSTNQSKNFCEIPANFLLKFEIAGLNLVKIMTILQSWESYCHDLPSQTVRKTFPNPNIWNFLPSGMGRYFLSKKFLHFGNQRRRTSNDNYKRTKEFLDPASQSLIK